MNLVISRKNSLREVLFFVSPTLNPPQMMMMINFINVSRPHSLGKSHTNLGTQLTNKIICKKRI